MLLARWVAGVVLFFYSRPLSHNALSFYLMGISLGILVPPLIILYFVLGRKINPLAMGTVLTVSVSTIIQMFSEIFAWILEAAKGPVFWVCFAILITLSFMVTYWIGPPSEPRTLNIIEGFAMVGAMVLIHSGVQAPWAAWMTIIMLVFHKSNSVGLFRPTTKGTETNNL